MEQQKITIGYWKIRGLAQQILYQLAYLGVDYDVKYYECGDGPEFDRSCWFDVKPTLGYDFPNLPYMQDGETKISET